MSKKPNCGFFSCAIVFLLSWKQLFKSLELFCNKSFSSEVTFHLKLRDRRTQSHQNIIDVILLFLGNILTHHLAWRKGGGAYLFSLLEPLYKTMYFHLIKFVNKITALLTLKKLVCIFYFSKWHWNSLIISSQFQ